MYELGLTYLGGTTVYALIWGPIRNQRWNGTAMVAPDTIFPQNWMTGMVRMYEQNTNGDNACNRFIGSFPTGITTPGEYEVEYYIGNGLVGTEIPIASQLVNWKGTAQTDITQLPTAADIAAAVPTLSQITGVVPTADQIATATLLKNLTAISKDSLTQFSLAVAVLMMMNSKIEGSNLNVYNTDGTLLVAIPIRLDGSAAPVTGVGNV